LSIIQSLIVNFTDSVALFIHVTLSDRVRSPGQKRLGRVGSRVKGSDPVPCLFLPLTDSLTYLLIYLLS